MKQENLSAIILLPASSNKNKTFEINLRERTFENTAVIVSRGTDTELLAKIIQAFNQRHTLWSETIESPLK